MSNARTKNSQIGYYTWSKKSGRKETPQSIQNKVDYKGDTNEKTCGSDDSTSETNGCVINLSKAHENKEDEEFKENTSEKNYTNESKISKCKPEEDFISILLAKNVPLKVIQAFIFSIDTYEQSIISVVNKKNTGKAYRVLSCVIYTIIKNYICIDYLAFQSKKLSEIPMGYGGVFKHEDKSFYIILGIGIPDLLMNLMSCNESLKNINSVFVLKFPKRVLK